MYLGIIFATWAMVSWLDTTSVELPEFTDPPIAYDHLSSEKTEPYLVRGKSPETGVDIRAARRWPDVRSCLMRSEHKAEKPDLRKMNWGKMRRKEDVEVCLFRIAASIGSAEDLRDWFVSQGMQRVRIDESPKTLNTVSEGMWTVTAGNSFSTGKTFRASAIPWRYWIMIISRGENFGVLMMQNGNPLGTDYFDNNIL